MGYRPTVRTDMRSRLEFVDQPGGDIELQIIYGIEQEMMKRREKDERIETREREARARNRRKA